MSSIQLMQDTIIQFGFICAADLKTITTTTVGSQGGDPTSRARAYYDKYLMFQKKIISDQVRPGEKIRYMHVVGS